MRGESAPHSLECKVLWQTETWDIFVPLRTKSRIIIHTPIKQNLRILPIVDQTKYNTKCWITYFSDLKNVF